jgi:hypothetical protein
MHVGPCHSGGDHSKPRHHFCLFSFLMLKANLIQISCKSRKIRVEKSKMKNHGSSKDELYQQGVKDLARKNKSVNAEIQNSDMKI